MTSYNQKDAELAQRILRQEYLPPEFMGYMNDYMAMNQSPIPLSNIMGVSAAMLPIGAPFIWLTDTAPTGCVILDGSNVSRTTYVLLFELWGTTFGAGNGSTTFGLPDFRGRMPVGKGTHTNVDVLGETEGDTVANRTPKHHHAVSGITVTDPGHTHGKTDPGHVHGIPRGDVGGTPFDQVTTLTHNVDYGIDTGSATTGITINSATTGITLSGNIGGTAASTPLDGPAYITVNFATRYLIHSTPQPVTELNQPLT